MAVINKFNRDQGLSYGNENAAASFYLWLSNLFNHPEGYSVIFDREISVPDNRQQLPFPCIVANQIDTTDSGRGFFGGDKDQNNVLFYIYCMVTDRGGGARSLRRMKDQVTYAIKRAGVFSDDHNDILIPPIILYDFSTKPPTELNSTLRLNSSIMQHFISEGGILEYEMMLNFVYHEDRNV